MPTVWRHAIWDPIPDLYYCQAAAGLLAWGVLTDETTVCSFTTAAVPRQRSDSRIRVPRDLWPYLTARDEIPPTWKAKSPYLHPHEQGA
jgi:hypothetical protein